MKKLIFLGLIVIAAAVIIAAFFMPWAKVDVSVTGVSKELASGAEGTVGKLPLGKKVISDIDKVTSAIDDLGGVNIQTKVSGYNIPNLVNNKTSKVALSLAEILFKSVKDLDLKSYLVYLLPLLAIACVLLALLGAKNKAYLIIMVIISGAVSIGGLYNINTMDTGSLAVKISIERGMWYTMYAFLFICAAGIVWFILDRKKA
jgi:hypothetical protein